MPSHNLKPQKVKCSNEVWDSRRALDVTLDRECDVADGTTTETEDDGGDPAPFIVGFEL